VNNITRYIERDNMSYTDRIPYKGKGAKLIIQDKWREAEEAHTAAQLSGDAKDFFHAAELFDELNGHEAEAKAKQCRKAARLLLEAE